MMWCIIGMVEKTRQAINVIRNKHHAELEAIKAAKKSSDAAASAAADAASIASANNSNNKVVEVSYKWGITNLILSFTTLFYMCNPSLSCVTETFIPLLKFCVNCLDSNSYLGVILFKHFPDGPDENLVHKIIMQATFYPGCCYSRQYSSLCDREKIYCSNINS